MLRHKAYVTLARCFHDSEDQDNYRIELSFALVNVREDVAEVTKIYGNTHHSFCFQSKTLVILTVLIHKFQNISMHSSKTICRQVSFLIPFILHLCISFAVCSVCFYE